MSLRWMWSAAQPGHAPCRHPRQRRYKTDTRKRIDALTDACRLMAAAIVSGGILLAMRGDGWRGSHAPIFLDAVTAVRLLTVAWAKATIRTVMPSISGLHIRKGASVYRGASARWGCCAHRRGGRYHGQRQHSKPWLFTHFCAFTAPLICRCHYAMCF